MSAMVERAAVKTVNNEQLLSCIPKYCCTDNKCCQDFRIPRGGGRVPILWGGDAYHIS